MAKRFNVSLPDELAKRAEGIKSQISLSELMQNALEKELSRLLRTEEEKARSEVLLRAAKEFWKKDRQILYRGAYLFVEYYLDKAAQDQDYSIFKLYCKLEREAVDQILSGDLSMDDDEKADPERPMTMIMRFLVDYVGPHNAEVSAWFAGYMGDIEVVRDSNPSEAEWGDREMLTAIRETLADRLDFYLGKDAVKEYLK